MDVLNLQLTPEMREAIVARPDQPVYIADRETQKIYVLVEKDKLPQLDDEYIRARLEEGFAAIERGEVEDWNAASIKEEGRRILEERQASR